MAQAAPRPAPAPARLPANFGAARPKPKPQEGFFSRGFGDFENAAGRTFQNIPGSAYDAAAGVYDQVRHPIRTVQGLHSTLTGAMVGGLAPLVGKDGKALRDRAAPEVQAWEGTKKVYGDRYGSGRKILRTLQTDPVGTALDASVVAGGAGGLVRGGARALGRAAVGAEVGGVRGAARFA
ncbi:hypothetical protein, partial [Phenylobacterium sp.]|uniref:hypothetical protein n=1 Tax=Phenylobacterium sp. TaxID=1871053 RepID=UPI00374CA872